MAPTSDPRPEPAPAPAAAKTSLWTRPFDHPILTALTAAFATLAVGMPFLILRIHGNEIDIPDTTIDTVETRLTARIDKVDDKLTDKIDELDAKVDEINLNLTTQINELDLKLSAQFYELNVKLTALIAGLGMTDLVDSAAEGRLPAAEPTGAPN